MRRAICSRERTAGSTVRDPLVEGLSDRERVILDHVARGVRNQEIADSLNIGLSTVRTHLRNIFRKLHVRSRTEAVARYRRG